MRIETPVSVPVRTRVCVPVGTSPGERQFKPNPASIAAAARRDRIRLPKKALAHDPQSSGGYRRTVAPKPSIDRDDDQRHIEGQHKNQKGRRIEKRLVAQFDDRPLDLVERQKRGVFKIAPHLRPRGRRDTGGISELRRVTRLFI